MEKAYVSTTTKISAVRKASDSTGQNMFPVVDDDNRYRGYILTSDLNRFDQDTVTVKAVLDSCSDDDYRTVAVHPDDDVEVAKKILIARKLPFVPVVDYNGYYMGTLDKSST